MRIQALSLKLTTDLFFLNKKITSNTLVSIGDSFLVIELGGEGPMEVDEDTAVPVQITAFFGQNKTTPQLTYKQNIQA